MEDDVKTSLKLAMAAGIGIGAIGLAVHSASAMPMSGVGPAVATSPDTAKNAESVRWVCGPYRCHWAPGWGPGYGYWAPGLGYGYGYYHPWRPHSGWYGGGPYGYR
jgi:hypothetical protein